MASLLAALGMAGGLLAMLFQLDTEKPAANQLAKIASIAIIINLPLYLSKSILQSIYRTRYRYNSDIKTNYLNGTETQCVISGNYAVTFGTSLEFKINGQDGKIIVNETFDFFKTLKTATLRVKPLVGIPREVLALAAVVNYLRGKTRFIDHRAREKFLMHKQLTYAQYISIVIALVTGAGSLLAVVRNHFDANIPPDSRPSLTGRLPKNAIIAPYNKDFENKFSNIKVFRLNDNTNYLIDEILLDVLFKFELQTYKISDKSDLKLAIVNKRPWYRTEDLQISNFAYNPAKDKSNSFYKTYEIALNKSKIPYRLPHNAIIANPGTEFIHCHNIQITQEYIVDTQLIDILLYCLFIIKQTRDNKEIKVFTRCLYGICKRTHNRERTAIKCFT